MLKFHKTVSSALSKAEHLTFIASEKAYKKKIYASLLEDSLWDIVAEELGKASAKSQGKKIKTYTRHKNIRTANFSVLPQKVSRGNSPTRKQWIFQYSEDIEHHDHSAIVIVLDDASHYLAAATAIARHERLYNQKTGKVSKKNFHIIACLVDGSIVMPSQEVKATAQAVSWACKIVDTAPAEMNPEAFANDVKSLFKDDDSVKIKEFKGDDLLKENLAGIYAVGKSAPKAPRMLVLDYNPKEAKKTIALAGKGVTYDSGGLTLKISGSMVGMKTDCGGAAAIAGAFTSLVRCKVKFRVVAVLGIVENSIGPEAFRNDDIIHMHSGKTVEVNNTDAEGRIVLGDCVSYLGRNYKPDLIINAATLTGAQMISTGLLHAGVVTNQDQLEDLAKASAKLTGDLVAPLPFAPEFLKKELKSVVADMRNSVKNRMNAQSSCAAQFIYNHIEDLEIPWIHIDLAGPSTTSSGLGTGYGVSLIADIAKEF